jgi:hypothetical protein
MIDQEYFTVHHAIAVNVELMADSFCLPDENRFEAEIPAPFIVANEFSQLEQLSENAKSELKNNDFRHVIQLLEAQNSKLNLLLTYLLSQQDNPEYRSQTRSFGASQFSYIAQHPVESNTLVRAKLFLENPAAAIYCYGQVTQCQTTEQECVVTVKYRLIRDLDQDLIIKAALHQQQKLLRQRSLERDSK